MACSIDILLLRLQDTHSLSIFFPVATLAQMFQRLSCGFYALYPSPACSKFAQVFQRLLHSFLHCTVLHCLGYIARLRFTFRWEGIAASTNCSSNVNCCATLRTYLGHREQRSTMTEERNKTACSSKVN